MTAETTLGSPALQRGFSSSEDRLYLLPRGIDPQGSGLKVPGGAFASVDLKWRRSDGFVTTERLDLSGLDAWKRENRAGEQVDEVLHRLQARRRSYAGLEPDQTHVMGILNITPDSFSDGGDHHMTQTAVMAGMEMRDAGAVILDIGGESTRPGAAFVPVEDEIDRVRPVIQGLRAAMPEVQISIDSRKAAVMRAALDAGATIINDVTALSYDEASLALAAERQVPVCIMHMQGDPETMQDNPDYADALLDVFDYLDRRIAVLEAAGVSRDLICVDPGIGFGKSLAHNLALMNGLALFHGLGCWVMLGASRKSFMGPLTGAKQPKQRLGGSIGAAMTAAGLGAQLVRVHDVKETAQALTVQNAIRLG